MVELNRRELLRDFILIGAAAAVSPALVACGTGPEQKWRQITPADRLRALEKRQFPKFQGFSLIPELSLAAAQLRVQQTHTIRTVEEMSQAVKVLSHSEFVKVYGRYVSAKSNNELTLEFVEPKDLGTIYIDSEAVKQGVATLLSPNIKNSLKQVGIDPEIALTKETIIHAQSHMNQTQEKLPFARSVEVSLPNSSQRVLVTGMEGLFLNINDPENQQMTVRGISETLTQFATRFICGKAGAYIDIAPFRWGEDLLEPLFKAGKISMDEVLQVYHQQKSQTELLDRLGSISRGQNALEKTTPSRDMGVKLLTIIGLTVDGVIPQNAAQSWIERMYGAKIY